MTGTNVLRVNTVEEQADYRKAVAEILITIQSDHRVTLQEVAERIDVSLGTISNAANKKADLGAIYLNRLGRVYGVHHLDPYARLAGGRCLPVAADGEADVLPVLNMAAYRVSSARTSSSPGGVAETLKEQLDYLPDLRRLRRDVEALICRIEAREKAA
jgi:transcriptional regulator with XRE-family HTH domain